MMVMMMMMMIMMMMMPQFSTSIAFEALAFEALRFRNGAIFNQSITKLLEWPK